MFNQAFDRDFDMLGDGDIQEAINVFHGGQEAKALMTPVPWLFELMKALPVATRKWHELYAWSVEVLEKRMKVGSECLEQDAA